MGKKSREKRERGVRREQPSTFPSRPQSKIELVCLKIIHGAVYLMLFTPLVVGGRFFFPFVGPKGLYLMGLIEIAFFTWLFLAIYSPDYRPRKNALLFAIGAFLIISSLAAIFGADPLRSFWSKFERMSGVLMWYHLFALFLVLSSVFKRKQQWLKIFLFSVGVSVITCFYFWLSKAGVKNLPVAWSGSTLGNSSFFATYLLFNLFFAIYSFFSIKQLGKFKVFLFAKAKLPALLFLTISVLFMGLSLMYSGGRAATLSFFGGLGLVFLLYLAFESKKQNLRYLGKAALIVAIIVFIAGVVLLHWPNSPVQKWLAFEAKKARQVIWQSAWRGLKERPILGWGPQNFPFVFHKFFNPKFYLPQEYGSNVRFDQAHNIIMDNLSDAGILGLISYLSMFGAAFYILWKKYRKAELDFWTAAIPTALLTAHFAQNLTVFDMPASFLMLFLTFGFIGSIASPPRPLSVKHFQRSHKIFVFLLIFLLFYFSFSNFVLKPAKGNLATIRAMAAANDPQKRIEAYKQALHSSPMGLYQIRIHLSINLFKLLQKKLATKADFEILSNELEKSIQSSPLDYYSYLTLGKLDYYYSQVDKSKLKRSEQALSKAIELSPTKQEGYWELSKTEFSLGKKEEARALLEKALALEPKVAISHLYLIAFLEGTGEHKLAVEKAKEAIKLIPSIAPKVKRVLNRSLSTSSSATGT